MTVRQRIIIIVLVNLILAGNLTNFYIGKQRAVTLIEAADSTIDGQNDNPSNQANIEDIEPETVEIVTKALNPDGTEHRLEECNLIHVNWDPLEKLEQLPGIGPVLAKRIIEQRHLGFFIEHEDLLKVSGIGPKKLEQIINLICLAIPDVEI